MNNRYFYKSKGYYYIGSDACMFLKKELKVLGASYNLANKEWYVEATMVNINLINDFLKRNKFVEVKKESIVRPCDIELPNNKELLTRSDIELFLPELKLKGGLRDYQIDTLYYMVNHGNCINGSDCGTGKTRVAIFYCELLDVFPIIIVCPSSVKTSWQREWNTINPNRSLSIIDSKNKKQDFDQDVTIINYDLLGKKSGKSADVRFRELLIKKYKGIIADEIHFLKNYKSVRTIAFNKIVRKIPIILGLSGTVIMNRPSELISILSVIKRFKIFPSMIYYMQRYCNAKKTRFGYDTTDSNNLNELHSILEQCCYIRKEKRDVLAELPPLTEQYIECDLSNKKEYKKAEDDFIEYLTTQVNEEKVAAALRAEHLVKLNVLKQLSVIGKLKSIQLFIKDWTESNEDEKIVVFGCLKKPLEELHNIFKDSLLITGDNSTIEKQKILDSFGKESKYKILFANMQCIGTGVDGLQKVCSNAIIIEFPMKPTDLEQTISRLERSGQKNNINVYYLMCNKTIDIKIWQLLKQKKDVTDIVNRGQGSDLSLALIKSYQLSV